MELLTFLRPGIWLFALAAVQTLPLLAVLAAFTWKLVDLLTGA